MADLARFLKSDITFQGVTSVDVNIKTAVEKLGHEIELMSPRTTMSLWAQTVKVVNEYVEGERKFRVTTTMHECRVSIDAYHGNVHIEEIT